MFIAKVLRVRRLMAPVVLIAAGTLLGACHHYYDDGYGGPGYSSGYGPVYSGYGSSGPYYGSGYYGPGFVVGSSRYRRSRGRFNRRGVRSGRNFRRGGSVRRSSTFRRSGTDPRSAGAPGARDPVTGARPGTYDVNRVGPNGHVPFARP